MLTDLDIKFLNDFKNYIADKDNEAATRYYKLACSFLTSKFNFLRTELLKELLIRKTNNETN